MSELRTDHGAILRTGLDAVKAQARAEGKANAVAAVVTKDGLGIGYARMGACGWELDVNLRAAFQAGRVRDVRVDVGWMW